MAEPPVVSKANGWLQRLRGWAFGLFLFMSAFFGSLYFYIPFTPLIFFAPTYWRKYTDYGNGLWQSMAGGVIRLMFGVKTRVIGDRIDPDEMAIYIMNHRTSLDWFFFWNALYQQDPRLNKTEKIVLKGSVKHIPGAGWAMQCNSFIFLDRNFKKDKEKIRQLTDYYMNVGNNYQLLLFPEGTDRCPISVERNERYAAKAGLKPYSYVLHPRTTGFAYIVQQMKKSGKLKAIYDVTVGYKDKIVQTEMDIIREGIAPQEVHFQIIRIPIEQLPQEDTKLAEWITKRWAEKEEKLRQFYDTPRNQTFPNTPHGKEYELTPTAEIVNNIVVAAWFFVTCAWVFGLLPFPMISWFSLYGILFYLLVTAIYGGVESLAIERHRAWKAFGEHKWNAVTAFFNRIFEKLPMGLF